MEDSLFHCPQDGHTALDLAVTDSMKDILRAAMESPAPVVGPTLCSH